MIEAEAEAKFMAPGQFGLKALTLFLYCDAMLVLHMLWSCQSASLKLKDLPSSQPVTHSVRVVISRIRCQTEMYIGMLIISLGCSVLEINNKANRHII